MIYAGAHGGQRQNERCPAPSSALPAARPELPLVEVHKEYLAFYNEHNIILMRNSVFFTKPLIKALGDYMDRINEITDLIQNPGEYKNPHARLKDMSRPLNESFAAVQIALANEIHRSPFD
jgi:hypothetical protein